MSNVEKLVCIIGGDMPLISLSQLAASFVSEMWPNYCRALNFQRPGGLETYEAEKLWHPCYLFFFSRKQKRNYAGGFPFDSLDYPVCSISHLQNNLSKPYTINYFFIKFSPKKLCSLKFCFLLNINLKQQFSFSEFLFCGFKLAILTWIS
jgi:hypothetical protein